MLNFFWQTKPSGTYHNMFGLLRLKKQTCLNLLATFIAFFPTKPCFFQEICFSPSYSLLQPCKIGVLCHSSIKVTKVMALPNPRDTLNLELVTWPTCSWELFPCLLQHHAVWLSSHSCFSSHSTDRTSSVFITNTSFSALSPLSPEVHSQRLFF